MNNLTLYVPGPDGTTAIKTKTKDPIAYLARVGSKYPEGTVAVFFTGGGTRQYRKRYRGKFEFIRQTVGP